jgi:tetratricopeptide (TPR) repeat protein
MRTESASNLLGLLEHARSRHEARAEDGFDKAIAELKKLRQAEPQLLYNLSYILIDKGKKRLREQDTDTAQALFSEAYEVVQQGISLHASRDKTGRGPAVGYATAGRALRYLDRWDEALRYLDQSISADPRFIPAYLSQGWIHEQRRRFDDANAVATQIGKHLRLRRFATAGVLINADDLH